MTADEFMQEYAKLAIEPEILIAENYSAKFAEMKYLRHFAKKRPIPLVFPYSHEDVILDLIKYYEVDVLNSSFEFFHSIRFHYKYWGTEEIDDIFLEYNAIPIGDQDTETLVINLEDGVIEFRHTETPEPESVEVHGARCARNGESFLSAGLIFEKHMESVRLMYKDKFYFNIEETIPERLRIAAECTKIAGGEQFARYWHMRIFRLEEGY